MASKWDRVTAAVSGVNDAYYNWLETRAKNRQGGPKYKAAYAAWLTALDERSQALLEQWDPDADGYQEDGASPSVSATLRRYYAESLQGMATTKRGGRR